MFFSPSDLNECESGEACCAQLCINCLGRYECSCQEDLRITSDGCGCDGKIKHEIIMRCGNWCGTNSRGQGLGEEREGSDTKGTRICMWFCHLLLYELGRPSLL